MPYTTYRLDFYISETVGDVDRTAVRDYLQEVVDSRRTASSPFVIGDFGHFLMGLQVDGETFFGVFAKLRRQDLPRIGDEEGNEEDIDLEDDQGLIEKNFFVYDADRSLLVWQLNNNGSHVSRLSRYLSSQMSSTTAFQPVVESRALERLMSGDLFLSEIDVSFAVPRNPDMFPTDATSQRFLELMQGLNAQSISIHASANAPGYGTGRHLYKRVKRTLQAIADMQDRGTRVVRATVEGTKEIIDLIADRLVTEITVPVRGRYPDAPVILNAMRGAIQAKTGELNEFFGDEEDRLE